jgi:ABC-2 type transport system permease protein
MTLIDRIRASAVWPMLWKEFIQMRRDRLTLGMMLGVPAIQLILFGYAIRTEVRHLPTVVLDQSRTAESRSLVSVMERTQDFDVVAHVTSRAAADDAMKRGRAAAAVIIPPEYARDIKRGRTARAQVVVDAADPLGSSAAIGGAQLAGAVRSQELASRFINRPPPLDVRVRPWYNPGLRSAVYIVPGIIGILLSLTMLIITAMSIVRERERGTLEQLVVTPIGKTALMLGKITPFVLVGYVQMTVVLVLGKLLFDVPLRGSLPLLYLVSLGFIVASLGLGLFVSTVVRTQAQAMQMGFLMVMPMILLSGFMFPREAMPKLAQWIGLALPITYYLRVLRGVLLRGVGLYYLWPDTLILIGFAVVLVMFSVRRFRKTVE